jgi:gas vesicle protein
VAEISDNQLMKAASSNEIKQELKKLNASQLTELCLRLARFKKENKELLTYLLFEEDNLAAYISNIKKQMDEDFSQMNITNLYFAKKTLRKILRIANKYIRYTGSKEAEAEILMHYLTNLKGLKISWKKSTALTNLYQAQIKKIKAAVDSMHEDLQYDHKRSLDRLVDF